MSDASKSVGFRVLFWGHWCADELPQQWVAAGLTSDVMFMEFFPILVVVWLGGGGVSFLTTLAFLV